MSIVSRLLLTPPLYAGVFLTCYGAARMYLASRYPMPDIPVPDVAVVAIGLVLALSSAATMITIGLKGRRR